MVESNNSELELELNRTLLGWVSGPEKSASTYPQILYGKTDLPYAEYTERTPLEKTRVEPNNGKLELESNRALLGRFSGLVNSASTHPPVIEDIQHAPLRER